MSNALFGWMMGSLLAVATGLAIWIRIEWGPFHLPHSKRRASIRKK
jgi:hypothetical protein